ncbi:glyoxalase/bleomycin resistance protein/dioxygenase superfamily protein [Solirubrobacter pauli]|uniref:Glyoxalase/bleomycin resistance protein/dioxygenase superfamily protein n=1 Tax=Solirubrobacter pauli TaxID=166793 RepID=A0A660KX66_9ACTN|nr:VOC family protein [Solirubrobacter pauli]RKQ86307.1 glyoxalase/bleomycin resistance protein/dioxygenase superfamily protein [Solirubrobacter pauli]
MSAIATTFATGHVGLNVTDLERSVAFYQRVFGWSVRGRGDGYAFLGDDARLVLTLWEQASGTFGTRTPGLHHLSFEVETVADVQAAGARVREEGLRLYHDGTVPHGEGASSGGVFFEDPDGIRLEVFTGAGVHGEAPTGTAPTCGFF